jgi:hypothetical protein
LHGSTNSTIVVVVVVHHFEVQSELTFVMRTFRCGGKRKIKALKAFLEKAKILLLPWTRMHDSLLARADQGT